MAHVPVMGIPALTHVEEIYKVMRDVARRHAQKGRGNISDETLKLLEQLRRVLEFFYESCRTSENASQKLSDRLVKLFSEGRFTVDEAGMALLGLSAYAECVTRMASACLAAALALATVEVLLETGDVCLLAYLHGLGCAYGLITPVSYVLFHSLDRLAPDCEKVCERILEGLEEEVKKLVEDGI